MKNFSPLLLLLVLLLSSLNYGCEHLCEDENDTAVQKEVSMQKIDSLKTSEID